MFVRSICLSIFLLFSIFDRCNLPLDEFGVKPGTLGTLLPSVVVPQQAEQLLVEPTLVSVQKRASISKVMSAFRQLNKQRRKANANSVRRPHCSHLLCAWICEFDGHLSNDTLQWHMHSFWKSHRRGNAAAYLSKPVTEKDRCFLSWFILMFYKSNNVRYHRDTVLFLICPYCCIHTRFSLWYKICLWFRGNEKL